MVYQLFDKKVSSSGNKSMPSQQLADELHKQILKKNFFKKVYTSFKDNIWGPDLADMYLVSKYNYA